MLMFYCSNVWALNFPYAIDQRYCKNNVTFIFRWHRCI